MRLNGSISRLVLPALLIILFGFFLFQVRWVAMLCLAIFMVLLFIYFQSISLREIYRIFGFKKGSWPWIVIATLGGVGLAIFYREYQGETLYPDEMKSFAITAVLIGISEELIFRGYFFGKILDRQKYIMAILLSATLHASYKTAIFFPFDAISLVTLAIWTLAIGILLAYSRWKSGSIWPCVFFHAIFDLWVYGDKFQPWWVW